MNAPLDIPIPPRPQLIEGLMKERSKEEPNFQKVEQLIATDIAVSAALIKYANSPALGLSRQITSVNAAMQTLGMQQVIGIASGLVLRHLMKGGDPVSMERFWDTTDKVSALAGGMARRLRFIAPADAQSYALFHDCGIPVLMQRFGNYKDVLRAANAQDGRTFIEVEDEMLGTNHAVVGGLLARSWGLPDETVLAIQRHHDLDVFAASSGDNGTTRTMVGLGHLSEHLHHVSRRGSQDIEWLKFGEAVLNHFGLTEEDLNDLIEEMDSLS